MEIITMLQKCFSEVKLPNLLVACETEGFNIISIDKKGVIVQKIKDG